MHTFTVSCNKNEQCDFSSINAAFTSIKDLEGPVTLLIKEGVYHEVLELTRPFVTLKGEGPSKTVISMNRYAKEILDDGLKRGTFRSQTLFIDADNVTLKDLTVENTAGPGGKFGQALALYADGDGLLFENVHLKGFQDTLFTAPLPPSVIEPGGFRGPKEFAPRRMGHHIYRNCLIEGTVDFIFGGAACLFESCELRSRFEGKGEGEIAGYVTAASTPENEPYGYIFKNCRFTAEEGIAPASVYLGRPWRDFAKTVLINCELGSHIHPDGFHDWGKPSAREHCFYAEYGSKGPGARKRSSFSHDLSETEAAYFSNLPLLSS
jgi:pectinesterase